jgi:hypothetical protein
MEVRWKWSVATMRPLAIACCSFIAVFAIVGPPDLLNLVEFCRQLPQLFETLAGLLQKALPFKVAAAVAVAV